MRRSVVVDGIGSSAGSVAVRAGDRVRRPGARIQPIRALVAVDQRDALNGQRSSLRGWCRATGGPHQARRDRRVPP